jgi:hypothetical protein
MLRSHTTFFEFRYEFDVVILVQRGGSKWQMVILEAVPMMEIVVFRMR